MADKKTLTICFANNKGGSGKTTTCANIGYALTLLGKKVLMIDGDMQMNLTLSFYEEDEVLAMAQGEKNIYYAMKEQKSLEGYITKSPYENLDFIPSSSLMSGIEYELFTKWQREYILRRGLRTLKESAEYDYILIDAPPTLGGWVMNLLCASDKLIIPVEASPWGLFGLANLFEFIRDVGEVADTLSLMGIAITKVDTRKNYFKQTMETLDELENVYVFENYIRVDSSIEWSQDNSKPVLAYRKGSRSAIEYMELAKEVDKIGSRER